MTGGMGRTESTGRGLGRDVGRKNYLVSVARTALLELGPSWIDCSEAGAIRDEMPVAASRVFGVVGLNFPHVLAERAVEPDHGSGGLVWNGLNARPFADGTAFRQVRRSDNVAHTVKCSAGSDSTQCSL